jgi:phage gp29-like protein
MILDQFGREFISKKKPEQEALSVAPLLTSQRDYVASGLTPGRLAHIFREADSGEMRRQAELFEQLEEKDAHIIGEMGKRRNAINDIDFLLEPASDAAGDVKIADFIQEIFDGITDFDEIFVGLQDSVGKGFSSFEIHWDVSSGQAVPRDLEWLPQCRFGFTDMKTGSIRKDPLLISDANPFGDEIPAWKTIFHKYGGKSGNATRSGIYRVCAWMFLFKNYSIKDWATFCEIYGMPLRIGKYDPGAGAADKQALMRAIQAIGTDAAGIISKNTEIEFIETVKGATASDLWEKFISFCNREMSKAILGHALSADSQAPGSFASDKVKDMVRRDLLQADTRAAARTIRHQLIRPLVGFNFGWDVAIPTYAPDWEEQEDLQVKSTMVKTLADSGLQIPAAWAYAEFGIPEPEEGEAVITPPSSPNPFLPAKYNPGGDRFIIRSKAGRPGIQDAGKDLDEFELRLNDDLDPAMTAMIDKVKQLVETAADLNEVRDRLDQVFPEATPQEMVTLMQLAFIAAELAGRLDVTEER